MISKIARAALLVFAILTGILSILLFWSSTHEPWHEFDNDAAVLAEEGAISLAISLVSLIVWLLLKGRERARRDREAEDDTGPDLPKG